ncbi:MAG: hypothetical protein M3179_00050 [Actinomycetota bacterium]|nr:hypothetical protein [Actinomycetota bacterium]
MSPDRPPASPHGAHKVGAGFWVSAAVGWVFIGAGLRGILQKHIDTRPDELARFVVGGALVHDLLIAPVVIVAGVAVARVVSGRTRAVVQAALVVTAVVALFSYPLVRGYGLATNNPTSLPHNYAANLLVVLGLVWAAAALVALKRLRRREPAES